MIHLQQYLQENNAEFTWIHHDHPIISAQDGADRFGIELGQTAPTLVVQSDEGYTALIISGDYGRVDMAELGRKLGLAKLKLAKPEEVKRVTGYTVGTIPLIGHQLPVILDSQLFRYEWVYGGTGLPGATLRIKPNELERLSKVLARI